MAPQTTKNLSLFDVGRVPVEMWGPDHFSTLLYAESCAVNRKGKISPEKISRFSGYDCRLRIGTLSSHGDADCLEDMAHAGILEWNDEQGQVALLPGGWQLSHLLRKRRAEGIRDNLPPLSDVIACL